MIIKTLFLFCFFTHSSLYYIKPTENMPTEFQLISESLKTILIDKKENFEKLNSKFENIEKNIGFLKKSEYFFIIKSEIYRNILRFKPQVKISEKYFSPKILKEIKLKLNANEYDPFSKWLISSIMTDYSEVISSNQYFTYTQERKSGRITSSTSKKIQKRLNFIQPWMKHFLIESPKLFLHSFLPIFNKTISSIDKKINYLKTYNKRTKQVLTDIAFFQKVDLNITEKKEKPSEKVSEIIEPLLSKLKNKNLPIPVDDWLDEEDNNLMLSKPIIIKRKSGKKYTPPSSLPTPVDDWLSE